MRGLGAIIAGVVLGGVGALIYYLFLPLAVESVNELSALPMMGYSEIEQSTINTEFLCNGKISQNNQALFEDLIVYDYREHQRTPGTTDKWEWVVVNQARQPITIDMDNHSIRLIGYYQIYDYETEYSYRDGKNSGLTAGANIGIRGIKLSNQGNSVTVQGSVISYGSAEDYIESQSLIRQILAYVSYGLLSIGGVLFLLGIFRAFSKPKARY